MDKLLFIDKFNEMLLENQRIFKIHKVTLVNDAVLKIVFIVEARKYDKHLDEDLINKVEKIVKKIIPSDFDVEINFKKTYTEKKVIKRAIMDFVYKKYPFIFSLFKDSDMEIEIKGDCMDIIVYAQSYIYQFCRENELNNVLEKLLNTLFMETPSVRIVEVANKKEIKVNKPQELNNFCSIKLIDISITEHLVGIIGKKPRYIVDVKDDEAETMTLCGVVVNLNQHTYKKNDIENFFYTFTLNDTTSTIEVKFFPRSKKAREVALKLVEGDVLAIEGPLQNDRFSNAIVIFANRIARCDIDYKSIDTTPTYKKQNEYYTIIYPQPFQRDWQDSLFEKAKPEKALLDKTFVVFDLETTGITAYDKITEIGAVKIVDGEITEVFQTLVNPEMPIPPVVVEITGITNNLVKDAPTFEEVVADFYKFTYGSILVAHNAPFDMGFLVRQGRQAFYNFDNSVIDTLVLARQRLHLSKNNLGFICKKLNINLDTAHRAMSDALATAEVFKKLMSIGEKQ